MLPIHHWRVAQAKGSGGAGFRSLCLPIANRPLYRVSYTPSLPQKGQLQAMGFEPMPLSRLAPKASALTTRPNLLSVHPWDTSVTRNQTLHTIAAQKHMYAVPGGTRTPNPQIRSLMRYPLRHWDPLAQDTVQKKNDNSGI